MTTLRTIADLRQALEPFRASRTIGLVPTMGAFHDGHVALFRAARGECDVVVASLFVNPSQFTDAAVYRDGGDAVAAARAALGDIEPEYVAIANLDGQLTLAIAARIGSTRLIDNMPLAAPGERA